MDDGTDEERDAVVSGWAAWSAAAAEAPWTVGVEEEVMLLDPLSWMLASRSEEVLEALDREVAEHTAAETHGSVVELATSPHATVAEATAELADLRGRLAGTLEELSLAAAVAGTHPLASWEDTEVSPGARYQFVYASMRELARREPTFALHVHVAVPDERAAVRALDGLREELPLLLALSANSPYWQGRDSGLASARIPVFQAFPRTGTPRAFGSYEAYVEAVDVLIRSNAIPEPTFLWWDVRLQPRLGTIEIRIMDAQTRVADTAALVALVQCLVRREAHEPGDGRPPVAPEVIEENRFLATRDGVDANFVDPVAGRRVPVRELLAETLDSCRPHAEWLGCARELASVSGLAERPGALRQRAVAAHTGGLYGVLLAMHGDFVSARAKPAVTA